MEYENDVLEHPPTLLNYLKKTLVIDPAFAPAFYRANQEFLKNHALLIDIQPEFVVYLVGDWLVYVRQ